MNINVMPTAASIIPYSINAIHITANKIYPIRRTVPNITIKLDSVLLAKAILDIYPLKLPVGNC